MGLRDQDQHNGGVSRLEAEGGFGRGRDVEGHRRESRKEVKVEGGRKANGDGVHVSMSARMYDDHKSFCLVCLVGTHKQRLTMERGWPQPNTE